MNDNEIDDKARVFADRLSESLPSPPVFAPGEYIDVPVLIAAIATAPGNEVAVRVHTSGSLAMFGAARLRTKLGAGYIVSADGPVLYARRDNDVLGSGE